MLANDMNEEYGLTGRYLVEFCAVYGDDYQYLLAINDNNPIKQDLLYLYRNSALSRFVLILIPAKEIENILFSMEDDFEKDWNHAGGEELNLNDIVMVQLQQKWELIYILSAVYYGKAESKELFIDPIEDILRGIIQDMLVNNQVEQTNFTVH